MSGGTARTGTMLAFAAVVGSAFAVTAGVSQLSIQGTLGRPAPLAARGCDEPVFPYVRAGCPAVEAVPAPPREAEILAAPKAAPEVPKPLPVLATPIAPPALVTLAAIHVARTEAARSDLPAAPAAVAAPAPPIDAVNRPAGVLSPSGPAVSPALVAPAPFLSLPVGPEDAKLAAIVASPAAPVPPQAFAANESRADPPRPPEATPSPDTIPSGEPARTASTVGRIAPSGKLDAARTARSRPFEPIDQPRAVGQVAALDAPAAERPDGPPRNVRVIPIDRVPGSPGATVIPAPPGAVAAAATAAIDGAAPAAGEPEKAGRPSGPRMPVPDGSPTAAAADAPGGTVEYGAETRAEPQPVRLSRREQRRLARLDDEQRRRAVSSDRADMRRSELTARLGRIEAERFAREQRQAERERRRADREARAEQRRVELATRLDRLRADREARLRDRIARETARQQARATEASSYGQADMSDRRYDRRSSRRDSGDGWAGPEGYGRPAARPDQQVYYVRRPARGILGWLGATE